MAVQVLLLDPAREFLLSLEARLQAKALRTIGLLGEHGRLLTMPHARKLVGHDLSELRIRVGNNICRFFYFEDSDGSFVLTSGYIKKSDRTDQREIQRALRLKAEFLEGR